MIETGDWPPEEIRAQLLGSGLAGHEISLEVREPAAGYRSADPAVIIATISAVGAGLTALIAGLLQLRASHGGEHISIELPNGSKIDVPADWPVEKVEQLVELLGSEPPRRIIIPEERRGRRRPV